MRNLSYHIKAPGQDISSIKTSVLFLKGTAITFWERKILQNWFKMSRLCQIALVISCQWADNNRKIRTHPKMKAFIVSRIYSRDMQWIHIFFFFQSRKSPSWNFQSSRTVGGVDILKRHTKRNQQRRENATFRCLYQSSHF